ncbi:hypothetical protein [Kitasatospora sp. NPDC056731]|uniref:hypothetical protein n=1 Tax=Kitasatospora sp. NPDC056731 TaxID=3155422 RepID=UPI00342CCCB6
MVEIRATKSQVVLRSTAPDPAGTLRVAIRAGTARCLGPGPQGDQPLLATPLP